MKYTNASGDFYSKVTPIPNPLMKLIHPNSTLASLAHQNGPERFHISRDGCRNLCQHLKFVLLHHHAQHVAAIS